MTLVALAGLMAQRPGLSPLDGVYVATAAAMVLARYVDIARYHGTTGEGEPATMRHFARYALGLAIAAAALWGAAHGLGGW